MLAEAPRRTVEELREQLTPNLMAHIVRRPSATETQKAWELLIAGYLYLGGLGAGAFIVAVAAAWAGLELAPAPTVVADGWAWDWSGLFVLWGPFATALGALLLVFHLGRNRRRFWSAGINPRTSWMARGFSILVTFVVLGALVAVVSVSLPEWPRRAPSMWLALQAVAVVAALATAVYTGILLQSMRSIPAWRSSLLPLLFLASALSTGGMAIAVGGLAYGSMAADGSSGAQLARGLDHVEPFVLAVEAAVLVAYIRRLRRGGAAGQLSAKLLLSGRWSTGFWAGIVGLALSLPFALVLVNTALDSEVVTIGAALSVLVGGLLLRCGVLAIGVPEAPPLHRLARWRADSPVAVSRRSLSEATE